LPEFSRSFPGGTKRETLCLQIRVLDRQRQDFLIQLAVLGKSLLERSEEPEFVPVPKRLEEWAQLFEITLDRHSRVFRFPCSRRRSFVGVSHDRPVRGIGCLRELQVQVSRDTTSVDLLRKDSRPAGYGRDA
jgi:hypothetical protein